MRTATAVYIEDSFTVHVDADELNCGFKKLPYPTCISLVNVKTGKVIVWTPAAYKPRGYRAAALLMLNDALAVLKKGGV